MKVLLLSAYAAHSHVHWRQSLQALFPDWEWQVLELPPRHFSWRVRGNPLYWALAERQLLEERYDLLVATSMVDLATLGGLVPTLAGLPTLLYFHENQFEYPRHRQQHGLLEAQMVSLYSCLAADRIAFNSAYNRDTFLAGCTALLDRLPDHVPAGVIAALGDKSVVLPVPLALAKLVGQPPRWPGTSGELPQRPLRLVWSARFEHDKGGDHLLALLQILDREGLDYELAITGQRFRAMPPAFERIEREFSHRLVQFGYLDSVDDYHALLVAADLALSTALHEFQGLAILEAVAAGCLPVVPDRLVYPEIYPQRFRYPSHPQDTLREAAGAAKLVLQLAGQLADGPLQVPDVMRFDRSELEPLYRRQFQQLASGKAGTGGNNNVD